MREPFVSIMITPTVEERDDLLNAQIAWGYLGTERHPMDVKGQVGIEEIKCHMAFGLSDQEKARWMITAVSVAFQQWCKNPVPVLANAAEVTAAPSQQEQ